jgi:hypothetical protein
MLERATKLPQSNNHSSTANQAQHLKYRHSNCGGLHNEELVLAANFLEYAAYRRNTTRGSRGIY